MTTRIPKTPCPHCGYGLDAASAAGDANAVPKPGDLSLCIGCTEPIIFDQLLQPRRPRVGEVEAICMIHPYLWDEITRLRRNVAAARAERGPR